MHDIDDLVCIFNARFGEKMNTRLVCGADEPVYLPASTACPWHQVVFAHGFFSSALHEIAHWCIAGPERRKLVDYGYWYEPDGRTLAQQAAFANVEAQPQALEWILSKASAHPFVISLDNLNGEPGDCRVFANAVVQAAWQYCDNGLPARAACLFDDLRAFYGVSFRLERTAFSVHELLA